MRLQPFSDIRFRKLAPLPSNYYADAPALSDFYRTPPSIEAIVKEARGRLFSPEAYAALHQSLIEQYAGYSLQESVKTNIRAIAEQRAVCVTTGHQLCILGGPAFMLYKIVSTIQLARSIQPLVSDRKVVPVFWMASEDHDREEINHVFVNNKRIEWNTAQTGAVGRFSTDGLDDVLQQILDARADEGTKSYVDSFLDILKQHRTLASATRAWVNACFGEWGVVVIDPDDARLKRLFIPAMREELIHQSTVAAVAETNAQLKQHGFDAQVNPRSINLFYLGIHSRVRIESTDGKWHTVDNSKEWTQESLLAELSEHPEKFSPNVLMRPLYQETILPNVAYVGGPGEIAYWLQLKEAFRQFELPMPAVVLRDAAMLVSEQCLRRLTKLGLTSADLLRSKEEIIEQLIGGEKQDFSNEKNRLQVVYQELSERMASIDPTLKATALAELQRVLSGMDQLQAKVWKALKVKEEQKITAVNTIWNELFPEGDWQERRENILAIAMANDKELLRSLLEVFRAPSSTLVIAEI
jgi:bacillithiol biosynthesis cysteine-adding enzyme BshC